MSFTRLPVDELQQQHARSIAPSIGGVLIGILLIPIMIIIIQHMDETSDPRLVYDIGSSLLAAPIPISASIIGIIYYTLTKIITQTYDSIVLHPLKPRIS